MAFETIRPTIASVGLALGVFDEIRAVYFRAKSAQSRLLLYQAGTDTKFNNAINNIFSPTERTELGQMLTQLTNLINDWETNHLDVIGPIVQP